MTDFLALKWGSPKSWDLESEAAQDALKRYAELGMSYSAMAQKNTPEHREALCNLIDVLDADEIINDWSGEAMTKDEAKAYVREY